MNRDGKGAVSESRKPTIAFFFKILFRKFPQLLSLNILMLLQIIPLIFVAVVFFAGDKTPTTTSVTFAPLYGINTSMSSPYVAQQLDMVSIQMGLPVFSTGVTFTIILLAILLAVTWGWQNVGTTYVLRGLVRGDPVFVFSDYFYGIKKNLKQGFLFGLIDLLLSSVLVIDFIFFYTRTGNTFGTDLMYFVIFALGIIYILMRFYFYLLLITFDMKKFKIIKNSFIFSILGIKRNVVALLGIAVLIILHVLLLWSLISGPLGFTIILPFVYLLALLAFMSAYAAYPIIDRYLIAPYAKKNDEEEFVYLKPDNDLSSDATNS